MTDGFTVTSYSSTEEMLADQRAREYAADSGVVDRQREITWGSHAIKLFFVKDQVIYIFLRVDTLQESLDLEGCEDDAEREYYSNHHQELYDRNYRYGTHYSVVEPDGEYGSSHLVTLWPITEKDYEETKAGGWFPSLELRQRITNEIRTDVPESLREVALDD